jgi:hypothetical protein
MDAPTEPIPSFESSMRCAVSHQYSLTCTIKSEIQASTMVSKLWKPFPGLPCRPCTAHAWWRITAGG